MPLEFSPNLTSLFIGIAASFVAAVFYSKYQKIDKGYKLDTVSIKFLDIALSLMPNMQKEYYREEWYMMLFDQETAFDRFKHALGFVQASLVISAQERVLIPTAVGVSNVRRMFSGTAESYSNKFLAQPIRFFNILISYAFAKVCYLVIGLKKLRLELQSNTFLFSITITMTITITITIFAILIPLHSL